MTIDVREWARVRAVEVQNSEVVNFPRRLVTIMAGLAAPWPPPLRGSCDSRETPATDGQIQSICRIEEDFSPNIFQDEY